MKEIYFDHSATTAVKREVLNEMIPYFNLEYGNPSSLYYIGREAKRAIECARRKVARAINCCEEEILKKVYKNSKREYKVIDGVNTRTKEFNE